MRTSKEGLRLITQREGKILHVYKDSQGYPTAGVGHLLSASEKRAFPVKAPITQQQCDDWLSADLKECEDAINGLGVTLSQNEFDALVSLSFNIGVGGFNRSTVVRRLKAKNHKGAAEAILLWDKPKEIIGRRRGEYHQFLTPYPATLAETTAKPAPVITEPQTVVSVPPIAPASTDSPASDAAATAPETELQKIGNKANAIYTSFGTIIAGVIAWFGSSSGTIVLGVMGCIALLGIAYMITTAIRAGQKDKRDRLERKEAADRELQLKIVRETHAQEAQIFSMKTAADPNLQTVTIGPPPETQLPGSEE